jgi:hypothetical protein
LLSDESTHTLLADFPPQSLPALSVSKDNVYDNHVPVTTNTTFSSSEGPLAVPTFQYPTLDLDPTTNIIHGDPASNPGPPTARLLQRPSLARRATSSFIRASAQASTVAAFPLVHAVLFVFSLLAVTSAGEANTSFPTSEDESVVGAELEPDAGLGDVLRSGGGSRRRYHDRRRGQGNTENEQEHDSRHHHETSEQDGGDEDGEVGREAVLPGGWIEEGSSR